MVPDTKEWRTSTSYDFLDAVDTKNLAWECLRRNTGYQKDFSASIASDPEEGDHPEMISTRWGLRFPRPSQPHRPGTGYLLDA